MAKIKFSNGQTVNFNGDPTEADIEEVAQSLGITGTATPPAPPQQAPLLDRIMGVRKNVAVGVGKGVADTAKGIATLGYKLGTALGLPTLPGQEILQKGNPEEVALAQKLQPVGTSQNIGYAGEKIAEFVVPGTKISKATEALSFLPRVALRTLGDTGVNALQTGADIKSSLQTGGISAGIQTAIPVVGYTMKILGSVLKGSAGVLSGRGTDVVEQILSTPKSAQTGLRGDVVQTLKKDALDVREYISTLGRESSANYATALEELPKRLGKLPNVFSAGDKTTIKVGGQTYTLSMQGIKSQFTSLLREHGVKVDPKSATMDFLETRLKKGEENILKQVLSDVNRWRTTTPAGLDGLAAKINAYKKAGETSPELNGILGSLSKGVREYIGKRVPMAKEMVERFQKEQEFISELETYLGDVGIAKSPEGIKNTVSHIQTLFTKNKEIAREVLEKIPGGTDILGRQAGRELQTQVARSTSAIGSILEGVVNAIIPPKVIGEIVAYTGMAQSKVKPLIDFLQSQSPAIRATILQTILQSVGGGSDSKNTLSPLPTNATSNIPSNTDIPPDITTLSPEVQRLIRLSQ